VLTLRRGERTVMGDGRLCVFEDEDLNVVSSQAVKKLNPIRA
jgi:hypothetical protein